MRMQPFAQPGLEPFRRGPETNRLLNGPGHEKLDAEKKHKDKADKLHDCFYRAPVKKRGEPGEGDEAINDFHGRCAKPNQRRPEKAAPGSFIEDREIDWPDRNREQDSA